MLTILIYLLTFIELLCSFLLIGVILIQKTKQQGAGLAFGASMGESLFGSQAGNFLTRTTVVLGVIFLVNTTLLGVLGTRRQASSSVTDRVSEKPAAAAPAAQPQTQPAPAEPLSPTDFGTAQPPAEQTVPPAGVQPDAPAPAAAPDSGK